MTPETKNKLLELGLHTQATRHCEIDVESVEVQEIIDFLETYKGKPDLYITTLSVDHYGYGENKLCVHYTEDLTESEALANIKSREIHLKDQAKFNKRIKMSKEDILKDEIKKLERTLNKKKKNLTNLKK